MKGGRVEWSFGLTRVCIYRLTSSALNITTYVPYVHYIHTYVVEMLSQRRTFENKTSSQGTGLAIGQLKDTWSFPYACLRSTRSVWIQD